MTVREAFAKAGYPVPEGKALSLVMRSYEDTPDWGFWDESGGFDERPSPWFFKPQREEEDFPYLWYPCTADDYMVIDGLDLSNLPAEDAYDALPSVVREIISTPSPVLSDQLDSTPLTVEEKP